ncbi:MAG: hypothetical protein HY726_14900 [Candidatus Rokubacteria bacterium]|nr:hypothetical protein [Candidatus Rokubacteria bacterium]
MKRNLKRSLRWMIGLLVASGVLVLSPVTTLAQTGVAQGVLYEVLEAPPAEFTPSGARIMPGVILPIGIRLAQATETGTLQGSGTLEFLTGSVTVQAQSRVPVDPDTGFGTGQVDGKFFVNTVSGKLKGQLDLSPLTSTNCAGGPCPYAPITGSWSTVNGAQKTSGLFSGIFLIPFQVSGVWYYLDPSTGLTTTTPLQPNEFDKNGSPLIKLHVTLFQ